MHSPACHHSSIELEYNLFMPEPLRQRHSSRMKGYDYSHPGAYFVTVCTWHRENSFGDILDNKIILNDSGLIVKNTWLSLGQLYPQVELSEFVVMPDHFHGVLWIAEELDKPPFPNLGLPEIMRRFKSNSARRINLIQRASSMPVWQRGYYDRIIRSETELERICAYISNNPARWAADNLFPPNLG
jgi:putative transposase